MAKNKDLERVGQSLRAEQHARKAVREKTGIAFMEENKCWDELNEQAMRYFFLLRTHAAHSVAARTPEIIQRLQGKDKALFVTCLQALLVHLNLLREELNEIHALHKDKTGGANDHDALAVSFEIFNAYLTFNERHELILAPTSTILSNITAKIEEQLAAEGLTEVVDKFRFAMNEFIVNGRPTQPVVEPQITPEQDPSVITDVEIK